MEASDEILMQQVWMQLVGPKTSCSVIHPNTSCSIEIIIKCLNVVQKSSKLYAALYLVMFALEMKKLRNRNKVGKSILFWCKDYLLSLAFMSWLVGGFKMTLCILNGIGSPLDGRVIPLMSLLGSVSLFLSGKSRRAQISYFVFVRACRSAYIYLKKRLKFPISAEKTMCFVGIFAIISYLYFDGHQNLKNRNLLENIWGQV